jgi:hypothetical protein
MNQMKTDSHASRRTRLVQRALLVVLTAASALAADQAIARKAKGGLATGIHLRPAAQAAQANAAPQAAPLAPEVIKPIPHPRRHGAKGRGASR